MLRTRWGVHLEEIENPLAQPLFDEVGYLGEDTGRNHIMAVKAVFWSLEHREKRRERRG
jgi:hypothetical protein